MKASEVWGTAITDEANPAWPPQEMREWVNQQTQITRNAAAMGGLRFQC